MKRIATVLAVFTLCGAALFAQEYSSPQEPHLVFSISAGMSAGKDLWVLLDHPQPVVGGSPTIQDTLDIGRVLRSGIVAGLAASYYTTPRFGWTAEVTYFGFASEQRCSGPAAYQPEPEQINMQACDRAQGLHVATSIVGFLGGATYRFFPDRRVEPFLRAVAGLGLLGNSYVQTSGTVHSTQCQTVDNFCSLTLVREDQEDQFTFVTALSGGFSFALSPAYKVRFEGRDVITSLPVVTGNGSASDPSLVPTGRAIKHMPVFTIGIDIILERRHTRRY